MPAGGGPVVPPNSGTVTPSVTTASYSYTPSYAQGSGNISANGEPKHRHPQVPTQFLIHEEGGLERWFNLTITNVGLEAVADYTCVAVNAGGVMEKAISLTFEEPEPVRRKFVMPFKVQSTFCNSKVTFKSCN